MRRRDFMKVIAGSAAAWPLAAWAQQPNRIRRMGVLMGWPESDPRARSYLAAFRGSLAKLGWMKGSNLRIELRWSAADPDRMRTLAKELVDLRPDVIFSQTTPAITVFARETRTIPIVFVLVSDPIGSGFAASLAHPSGNITGCSADTYKMKVQTFSISVRATTTSGKSFTAGFEIGWKINANSATPEVHQTEQTARLHR